MRKSQYKTINNTDIPIVVLINKGSASASEILAWALQDHKRAIIVWEQSFWKGTVQEVISMQQGTSLRVTIAEWITPNWNHINKKWITPDEIIEKTKEDYENEKTPQIDKAMEIIKNYELEIKNNSNLN